LKDAQGHLLDQALMLTFPGPNSYTGEDVVEFHIHGGLAVSAALLDALGLVPGLRPAEPGEFTRRAVLAGHMDLTAAEAVADLIDAETDAQRRQALGQLGGRLAALYDQWRVEITRLRALVEAEIDFVDEDLGLNLPERAAPVLGRLISALSDHLADNGRGERLRQGVSIAIAGHPNVGKSSIVNRLAGREAAIVSARAGTTRDVIEVHLDLGGVPVILADTAGLRDSDDPVEAEGIARARARMAQADLTVFVDTTHDPAPPPTDPRILWVRNKIDEAGADLLQPAFGVSALTGAGFDVLIAELAARAADLAGSSETPVLTRARHRHAVTRARDALTRVTFTDPELAAEDLRLAADALGSITGAVHIEQVLDLVFAEFCIGK
jgi:tRNA modification GTPase